jgi:pimeloyl-ACP methyl ester carboxylesterase
VGASLDVLLAQLGPWLGESVPGPERDAVVAAINGVLGDHLAATNNPLAITMRLRSGGVPLELDARSLGEAFPHATGKLVVLVHGSSMSDRQWLRRGHDHGAALARDLGYTPVYLHYNSGLHISTNGRAFASMLASLHDAWPVAVEDITLVGHSMGGLVSRSACHIAEAEGHRWRSKLRNLVFLGSPHHGAPLERGGNLVEQLLRVSRYSAPLAPLSRIRSAGVTDLRYGNVLDEHWHGRDRFALARDPRRELKLPAGVRCFAVAGTSARQPRSRLPGDGLVPVDSALGRHREPTLRLAFPVEHQWIGFGVGHLELLERTEVYETVRRWLDAKSDSRDAP